MPATSPPSRPSTTIDAIAEHWVTSVCVLDPTIATYVGRENGTAGEWPDFSPAGAAEMNDARLAAVATLDTARPADDVDVVTKTDLLAELRLGVEQFDAGVHLRELNVIASPVQGIREIFDIMPTSTEKDWADISDRLGSVTDAISGYIDTLREGIARGIVPAARQVREVMAQVVDTARPRGVFAELAIGAHGTVAPDAALAADLDRHAASASEAYGRLAEFLEGSLLPAASRTDAVGRDLYALASRSFLGATIDLDEAYEWGIDELDRMVAEQTTIARQILPGASIADAITYLEADPTRKLRGTEALREWMQSMSDRAIEELSRSHFDIPEEVRTLECMIAPSQNGVIYYTGPTDDFSRPGRMWWSVPDGVTEFDTWRELTTVYHEGVPGHHLQIGQAVHNRAQLNSWRRLLAGTSGHAEGWALYAERLMAELGYLDDPADRLGMLDGQRMRAARVVLDIGVHLGKSRPDGRGIWDADFALQFMRANVNMDDAFVRFEVNRYLGWPGQAPSYKIGQRIWEQVRDECRKRDGAEFDVKSFHKRALDLGGVGLDTLRSTLAR